MFTDKKTLRYFKHKFHGGKSASAHLLDRIFGSLMLLVFLTLLLRFLGARLRAAAILSACLCSSILLFSTVWQRYRFYKFLDTEQKRIQDALLLESLILLPEAAYRTLCNQIFSHRLPDATAQPIYGGLYFSQQKCFCYAFHNHPQAPVGIHQMMALYRILQKLDAKQCYLLSPSPYVDDAKAFSKRLGIEFTLLGQPELLKFAHTIVPPAKAAAMQQAVQEEMKQYYAQTNLRHTAISPHKYRAYLSCAFFLICWYFLFRLSVLYPIAAGICCILAAFSYRAYKKLPVTE